MEDVQGYVSRLDGNGVSAEEVESGLWVLTPDGGGGQIVVNYAPPVIVLRVNVMEMPADGGNRAALMRKLLELNAEEMVHGSYGIEDSQVVLTDALQIENLDFTEFQASIESITLALGSHLRSLASYQE
jgi:hypothetical protein